MEDSSHAQMVSLIWNIADDVLRDVFLRGQYRDVILPMIVLRRLDALLEPTKAEVDAEVKENGIDADVLFDITKLPYYNTSKWTLNILKAQATDDEKILLDNFNEYLLGFSENVRDVLRKFGFISKDGKSAAEKAQKLSDNHRLLSVIERVTDTRINLTDRAVKGPDGLMIPPLDNIGMGKVFEELLRRFNEENNEEAGEHFTPRDAIMLLTRLIFEPIKDNLPKTFSLYDPACGSGGMLTESQRYLTEVLGVDPAAIFLSGTEVNPETYAICKSDLIIKGTDSNGIRNGNTITQLEKVFADDGFAQKRFGYMITNPPYGKSWKEDEKKIYHDNELLDDRFRVKLVNFAGEEVEVDATPRTSDGQLLFILEMLSKMTPLESQPQGTRIASVHNGSALFTGDAGSGESDTRRYLLENDLVEAIVQLPNNIFYNTGITTYVWIITNKKEERRKGKIQLIDASQAFEKLRKNQGQRNCMIDEKSRDMILAAYMAFDDGRAGTPCPPPVESKIFSNDDFRYYAVTVERPLRLRAQFTALKIDALRHDAKDVEFSQYLYSTFGDKVYDGLTEADKTAVKEYLQEAEIKKTDKQLKPFFEAAKWRERRALMEAAKAIKEKVGEEVFMDYNAFLEKVIEAAPKGVTAAQCKTIARAMATPDPAAERVVKGEVKANAKALKELCGVYGVPEERLADYGYFPTDRGTFVTYEPDTDLRDGEKIPVKEDIWEYFQREVRPYAEDAWLDLPKTKIGCEISFTKHFYKPQPLRTLAENEADMRKTAEENASILKELLG